MLTPMHAKALKALNRRRVRFVLIGGFAIRAHGVPRAPHDLDLWIEPTPDNAQRVAAALSTISKADPHAVRERASAPGNRIVVPREDAPEVDLLTSIGDLDFSMVHAAARIAHLDGQPVRLPTREHLIATKHIAIAEMRKQLAPGAPIPEHLQRDIDRDERDIVLLLQS